MKKIGLYYFSGTGMTEYVVGKFKNEFEQHHIAVDCLKIEDSNPQDNALSEYDALGIASPVHAFNIPQIVIEFAKKLPECTIDTFIILTAAEDAPINYAASELLIKRLMNKSYKVFYNRILAMPANFLIRYSDERVNNILSATNERIPQIAEDILALNPYFMKSGPGTKALAVFIRPEWYGAHLVGKFYYAKSNCTRCGKCVRDCPNKNIVMTEKGIRFHWHCSICMRCIFQCPQRAICIHQPFKFIYFDDWYLPLTEYSAGACSEMPKQTE